MTMKKINILIALGGILSFVMTLFICYPSKGAEVLKSVPTNSVLNENGEVDEIDYLYREMQLEGVVTYEAFRQGITGFNRIDSRNKDILALVDFSKPSTEERLFIFDLANREVLFTTHVSHGRNSGGNYANSFSNVNGSYQSSLGFYLTEHTYQGKNGYSLVLEGLEAGINDRAKERAIVMHGAAYSNPSVLASGGRLGRSLGCSAVPETLARPVIDILKDGAVLFIFADQPNYRNQSSFLS